MVLRRGRSSRAVHLRPASWEAVQESVRGGRAEDSESPRFYEDRGARLASARASFAISAPARGSPVVVSPLRRDSGVAGAFGVDVD